MILQEQYIELSSGIDANSSLFGAQERTASQGLSLQRTARPLAMWNHDTLSANADTNLYGSHPFILEVRPGISLLLSVLLGTAFWLHANTIPIAWHALVLDPLLPYMHHAALLKGLQCSNAMTYIVLLSILKTNRGPFSLCQFTASS